MLRNSMLKTLLIGMITLLSAGTALTQTPAGTETPVDTGTPPGVSTAATPYLLAGDDVLSINVVNYPNLSQPQVTLMPDGKLDMQLLEPFSILGKTTTEVAQILTKKWKRYLINPSVRVSLLQKRRDNVLVYGFVRQPCTIEYKPPMRLLEAVAQVGGPLPWADLVHVAVTRKGGDKETLDLSHPAGRGATLNDVTLNAGDVVYIPGQPTEVSVVGEVLRPGNVEFRDELTVEDAVNAAGGFKETADLAGMTLMHDGTETNLFLDALYRHGDNQFNVRMMPGDRLLIPEIRNRTFVFGAVNRPGSYVFKPGDHVMDAVNGSGGPSADADLKKVILLHIAQGKQSARATEINLLKFLKNGDYKFNVLLTAGDIIIVPKKHTKPDSTIWSILGGLGLVSGGRGLFTGHFGD